MRMLYYDCFAGISGDMNLGALLDLGVDPGALRAGLARLGLPGLALHIAPERRRGIRGTRVRVQAREGIVHAVRTLRDVRGLIGSAGLETRVVDFSVRVFERLAEAEARVHGVPVERVHFHEVGALDALADILGAGICLAELGWPRVTASAVELGSGWADCAHGRLPVPAPATLALLAGVPTRSGGLPFEATTPTGAAILVTLADAFDEQPVLVPTRVGYGVGSREAADERLPPNLLRVILGETGTEVGTETLVELACNIDDQSPELYPYLFERLLAAGALDAWLIPTVMKKGRPGILAGVLCAPRDVQALTGLLFAETSTLGVRRRAVQRTALMRELHTLQTRFGPVPVKIACLPDGTRRTKPEYEICRAIALENGVPLREVYREVERRLEEWNGE